MSESQYWTSINWNKFIVMFSLNWVAMSCGFTHGQMAGLIGALQKKDEGISLSENQIFLIAAFVNLCFVIGFVYLVVLGDKTGRRWTYMLCSAPSVVNWIFLYRAWTFKDFMISRFLSGISIGPLTLLNIAVTAEFTTHNTRAFYISVVTMLTLAFGVTLGHVLGMLMHWRTTALLGIVISTVHLVLPYFWVESPHWLASKGKFAECETAFKKLHGDSGHEHELELLIKMETTKQKAANEMKSTHAIRKLLLAIRKKYFWDLIVMATFILFYYTAAGKVVFSNLATVMLEDITGTPQVLLFTILIDAFILIGTAISCFFIKKLPVRAMLYSSGLTAVGILIVLSACLYFKNNWFYFRWINVILLCVYFVIIHAGPYPVMDILLGEMFPLELKFYFYLLVSPILTLTLFGTILVMPIITSIMGYHGLFLMNSAIMLVCLAYLYSKLPETKGKTLQEIEVYFKTKNFNMDEVFSDNEQIKGLI